MQGAARLLAATLLIVAAQAARGDEIADFYRGKQLSFIITGGVGGGYDSYGRTVSRHLVRHIPGAPGLVVQNMPGADVIPANHLYNVAPNGRRSLWQEQRQACRQRLLRQFRRFCWRLSCCCSSGSRAV